MELLFGTHEKFFEHDTGSLHPERPARLRAVIQGIEQSGLPIVAIDLEPATIVELALVHSPSYLTALERFCLSGGGHLDPDTLAGPRSWEAALLAAGAGMSAVRALRMGGERTAFLAMRPPGHHALPERAMGFCLLNNVAVTAASLKQEGAKVAILDWDVHHGNGTQAMFYEDPDVLYLSLHQSPFYPYLGDYDEVGSNDGEGFVINVPLPAGTAGDAYRYAWLRLIAPVLKQFEPDWLLVSCGYDAHHEDPLAELRLMSEDYGWMAASLPELVAPWRTVVFLEGGYHLPALEASSAATVRGLAGEEPLYTPAFSSPSAAFANIDRSVEVASRYWSL